MPDSVRRSRALARVVVALMVVRAGLTAAAGNVIVDAGTPERTRVAGLALVMLVVLGGLLLVCSARFAHGDNWARMLTTVVAVVCVLGGLLGVQQDNPVWFTGLNLVIGAVAAWLLATLYRPDASAWFAEQ